MLPKNTLNNIDTLDEWLYDYPTPYNPLIDYEMGGIALNDTTQGMDNTLWRLALDKSTGDLMLGKQNEFGQALLNDPSIKKVSLAFDLNMRPNYVLEYDDLVKFVYYDTTQSNNATLILHDVKSPYLTLDDRRDENSPNADILLCYIKGNQLCVRYQRDRYLIEHILYELPNNDCVLERVGMTKNWRMQFNLFFWQEVPNGG